MESEWEFDNEWVDASFENYIQEISAGYELIDIMESLLQYAAIPEERKERLYNEIHSMTLTEAVNLYTELKDKQVDRITSGQNYNQGHIKEHLNKLK